MKISIHSCALAGAITTSICYAGFGILLKTWPYETLQFISTAYMIPNLQNIIPYIKTTPVGIATGLSIHFIISYLFFFCLALFYNLFTSLTHK